MMIVDIILVLRYFAKLCDLLVTRKLFSDPLYTMLKQSEGFYFLNKIKWCLIKQSDFDVTIFFFLSSVKLSNILFILEWNVKK